MSDIDLTPVAEALFSWNTPTDPYFVIGGRAGGADDGDPYLPIVAAIAPFIEAAVREQVAREIEAARFAEMCSCPDCDCGGTPVERATAFIDAARIARDNS